MEKERDVPMKPIIIIKDEQFHSGTFTCPICGLEEEFEEEVNRFCPGCGQLLEYNVH